IGLLDDRGAQFAEFVYAARQRERNNVGSAALEPDANDDVLPLGQSDVFEQQAGHALALAVGCVWILPEPWEVTGQGQDALALLRIDRGGVGLALVFVLLLGVGQCTQLAVPVGLQRTRNQAVVRIDLEVAALRQLGLIAGALDLSTP